MNPVKDSEITRKIHRITHLKVHPIWQAPLGQTRTELALQSPLFQTLISKRLPLPNSPGGLNKGL